jgi:hypothetical protein
MRTNGNEVRAGQSWPVRIVRTMSNALHRRSLILLAVLAAATICAAHGQTLIGSPGAGWQTWSVTPNSFDQTDLNDNGAPFWDVQWAAAGSYGGGNLADKNAGFCMTSKGDCVGMGSAALAPGALSFWGMPYDSVNDTGGARDNSVYFHSNGSKLLAVLFLNASANPTEINEIGWFETNSTGAVVGTRHKLYGGTGVSQDQTPDPVGKVVIFTPTAYFGYYYSDVSEPVDATATVPEHGCYAYTLFNLDEPRCLEDSGGQGDHDFVVFSGNAKTSSNPTYWIAGEDPADCVNEDGDCNLTIMSVTALPKQH